MNVLVINCGSSSLKFQLINSDSEEVLAKGLCERIGIDGSLTYQPAGGEKVKSDKAMPTHTEAIQFVIDALTDPDTGVVKSLDEIGAVGHRVVHGGEKFASSAVITEEMKKAVEECNDLAPLHNPANLIGINACEKLMPGTPMVGVFDTAFHQTMPEKAYMYGIPYEYYEKYHIRKYGFHGTSHRYVSQHYLEMRGLKPEGTKLVVCHLGNGSSITAVKDGKCMDTSMGFTPLDGILMGTRSGAVDPSVVLYLENKENLSADQMNDILNKKSGFLGVSELSSDARDLVNASHEGNKLAKLACDMVRYEIKKFIGAYAAAMGGLDAVLFTGGIGENSGELRAEVCEELEFMGIQLDEKENDYNTGSDHKISVPGQKVEVWVIPTNEELAIALDTKAIIEG